MALDIHIISGFLAIEPVTVWALLQRSHPDLLTGARPCLCGETECTLDEVAAVIRKQGKPHFGISFEGGKPSEISYGHIRNFNHSLLSVGDVVTDMLGADLWVAPFSCTPGFREAWVFEIEYAHWQNAEDPLEYTAVGRSYAGLPMKSNGLPYPLRR